MVFWRGKGLADLPSGMADNPVKGDESGKIAAILHVPQHTFLQPS